MSLVLALLLALLFTAASAEVVDRIIAVVNEHLVTWSDLDEQMRFEALENRRALKDLSEAERRSAFEHLVQNRMLRDQMQGMAPATDTEIDAPRWRTARRLADGEGRCEVERHADRLRALDWRVAPAGDRSSWRFSSSRSSGCGRW